MPSIPEVLGESGEAEDLLGGGGGDADAGEFVRVHAGEDGDGEKARRAGGGGGLGCGVHHGGASAGVDGEEGGSGVGGGADGSGYGVGDVVELEVEEDVEAAVAKLLHDGVAGGVVELHPDFEPLTSLAEAVYQLHRLVFVSDIQRHGEAVFGCDEFCGRGHDSSLANDDLLGGAEYAFGVIGYAPAGCQCWIRYRTG